MAPSSQVGSRVPRVGSIRRGGGLDEPFDPVLVRGRLGEGAAHYALVLAVLLDADDLRVDVGQDAHAVLALDRQLDQSPTESSSSARNATPPRDTSIRRPSTTPPAPRARLCGRTRANSGARTRTLG